MWCSYVHSWCSVWGALNAWKCLTSTIEEKQVFSIFLVMYSNLQCLLACKSVHMYVHKYVRTYV